MCGRPSDRMPIFPVPDGHNQAHLAAPRGRPPGWTAGSRTACRPDYTERADYEIEVICDKGFPSYFLIVGRPDQLRPLGRHPGRPGPRFGRRIAGGLRAGHHQHRPDPARSAVRAVPQPRARVDARYRHRLRRPPPRRDGALRRREVGQRPGRPGHHLRHHQDQGGAEGFRAGALRPARFRDRRPDHQGAAAADHGQGHPAVGHHRPRPRAVQGGRRGPRPDRHRPRRRAPSTRPPAAWRAWSATPACTPARSS